jgi:hypothetical protein
MQRQNIFTIPLHKLREKSLQHIILPEDEPCYVFLIAIFIEIHNILTIETLQAFIRKFYIRIFFYKNNNFYLLFSLAVNKTSLTPM